MLCSGSSSPSTVIPAASTGSPFSTIIRSRAICCSVRSESWLPVATTNGRPPAIAASRVMQPRSAAVPLTVSSPALITSAGSVTATSRVISSVVAWLQCRSENPSSMVSPRRGAGRATSWPAEAERGVGDVVVDRLLLPAGEQPDALDPPVQQVGQQHAVHGQRGEPRRRSRPRRPGSAARAAGSGRAPSRRPGRGAVAYARNARRVGQRPGHGRRQPAVPEPEDDEAQQQHGLGLARPRPRRAAAAAPRCPGRPRRVGVEARVRGQGPLRQQRADRLRRCADAADGDDGAERGDRAGQVGVADRARGRPPARRSSCWRTWPGAGPR